MRYTSNRGCCDRKSCTGNVGQFGPPKDSHFVFVLLDFVLGVGKVLDVETVIQIVVLKKIGEEEQRQPLQVGGERGFKYWEYE